MFKVMGGNVVRVVLYVRPRVMVYYSFTILLTRTSLIALDVSKLTARPWGTLVLKIKNPPLCKNPENFH